MGGFDGYMGVYRWFASGWMVGLVVRVVEKMGGYVCSYL